MDQQNHQNPRLPMSAMGPAGRKLHIAHRRSPSELTPLMMEQLAIQQQIEVLQQHQQQIAATHQQYINMGIIQPQQHLPMGSFNPMQAQMGPLAQQPQAGFQFPQQLQPMPMALPAGPQAHLPIHRRNQSAIPQIGMGPPPAASSGASGQGYGDVNQQTARENFNPRSSRAAGQLGVSTSGHARRHSLALPEAKKAAELAEQKRRTSGFQFPIPGGTGATLASIERASSPGNLDAAQSSSSPLNTRGGNVQLGHGRSQSMAVANGRAPPQTQNRNSGFFQYTGGPSTSEYASGSQGYQNDLQRRGSTSGSGSGSGNAAHGKTASRNFEGNWRQQASSQPSVQEQHHQNIGGFSASQNAGSSSFQPGHRARDSMGHSVSSVSGFQFPNQPQLIQLPQGQVLLQQPGMYAQQAMPQGLNQMQLAQLQAFQTAQANGQGMGPMQPAQHAYSQMSSQQQQQQRKTLFTPYLPQAQLPALLSDGQLVAGTLRVNKKNRSDAYVTSNDLDADIFICGSKDRNRALEGDLVAIELLDVDEVWGQKREKEEKKKRKDVSDSRGTATVANDATTGTESGSLADGGLRRRGSLRQRPTQKKNDDVEVEGQSLLLMEEEEINDEQKPLYAGHVVAVIERAPGQMFSGTLGLLRPSSQATKEKQDAERQARDGGNGRSTYDRQQEKPKIVWFKPTDKRVPLIAIPTEQAPSNFVERHQEYANRIFVACQKRWPITSLHPFGTLVEQLGETGDIGAETDALLRDNNFGPDEFSDAVLKSVGFEDWSVEHDGDSGLKGRRDLRSEPTFTIDPNGSLELDDALHFKTLDDGTVEIGMHVADISHFVKTNSLVDREAKKRGTGVYLMNRTVSMLPARLATDICCLSPGQERYTISVIFRIDPESGHVFEDETWIGKTVIKSTGKLTYKEVDAILHGGEENENSSISIKDLKILYQITQKLRRARFGDEAVEIPALRLLYQLDDENVPVEHNIFDSSCARELVEELGHKTNAYVAQRIYKELGEKAWLRRHAPPNPRRLQTFADRMTRLGYDIETSSSGALQNSLFAIEDSGIRKGMETSLIKSMQRAKYVVAGSIVASDLSHFGMNLPLYTHFTNPSRRYADIVVHRQLEAALAGYTFDEDLESLGKTAELCNTKKDSAQSAQEQSVHIESCRKIEKRREELGADLVCEGIVLCVYESAFDVLIPEYGFEKRVHCDQLPLKKAEFDKAQRILELYWEKGVPSSAYIPEDERSTVAVGRGMGGIVGRLGAARDNNATNVNHETETSESSWVRSKYLDMLTLRTDKGNYIQDICEMTRVPVILKTDLVKSPPCLTIRAVNPYAS